VEEINYLHTALGVTHVGENRVQQLLERYEKLEREGLSIHFIGTLQTNKVKYIIDKVDMIQSLDSEKLAREIEKQASKVGRVMDVLIEINSGSEISKSGLEPEDTEAFARVVVSGDYPHIRLRGFMTMAPKSTEEEYRAIFDRTRRLCEGIWERLGMTDSMVMSMGMSESYIPAAACGSTMVRVGRGLFVKETDEPV
jgi:pyridoxal phosphate enzyme (YggS family)